MVSFGIRMAITIYVELKTVQEEDTWGRGRRCANIWFVVVCSRLYSFLVAFSCCYFTPLSQYGCRSETAHMRSPCNWTLRSPRPNRWPHRPFRRSGDRWGDHPRHFQMSGRVIARPPKWSPVPLWWPEYCSVTSERSWWHSLYVVQFKCCIACGVIVILDNWWFDVFNCWSIHLG